MVTLARSFLFLFLLILLGGVMLPASSTVSFADTGPLDTVSLHCPECPPPDSAAPDCCLQLNHCSNYAALGGQTYFCGGYNRHPGFLSPPWFFSSQPQIPPSPPPRQPA